MTQFKTNDSDGTTVYFDIEGDGTTGTPFVARTPDRIGVETSTAASSSEQSSANLNELLRGLWGDVESKEFEVTNAATTTTKSTIITVDVLHHNNVTFEVTAGSQDLTECQIQVRYHSSSGVWNPKTFGAAEYTSGSGKQSGNGRIAIIEASGDLNTLSASSSGWVECDCERWESVRLQISTAAASTVTARAIVKR